MADSAPQNIARVLNSPEMQRVRRRSLTSSTTNPPALTADPNLQRSRLLQLPAEIRREIWTYAFGYKQVHISYERGEQLALFRNPQTHALRFSHRFRLHLTAYVAHPCFLLRTCRQVYSETIDLLYSTAVFKFEDATSLILFSRKIAAERLVRIQTLHLVWRDSYGNELLTWMWRRVCDVLAWEMPGLRVFHLRLRRVDRCLEWAEPLGVMTQPLRAVVLKLRNADGLTDRGGGEMEIRVTDSKLLGKPELKTFLIRELVKRSVV